MRDDARSAVEFLDAAPGPPAPDGPLPARPRRRLLLALVLAAALAVLALAGHGPRGRPHAVPSVTTPPSTSAVATSEPVACPADAHCVIRTGVPSAVAAAVRSVLPGARIVTVQTVRGVRRLLWFRKVVVAQGELVVVVDIQHRESRPVGLRTSVVLPDGTSYVRRFAHDALVEVEAGGPRALVPAVRHLAVLARDVRLLRVT